MRNLIIAGGLIAIGLVAGVRQIDPEPPTEYDISSPTGSVRVLDVRRVPVVDASLFVLQGDAWMPVGATDGRGEAMGLPLEGTLRIQQEGFLPAEFALPLPGSDVTLHAASFLRGQVVASPHGAELIAFPAEQTPEEVSALLASASPRVLRTHLLEGGHFTFHQVDPAKNWNLALSGEEGLRVLAREQAAPQLNLRLEAGQ